MVTNETVQQPSVYTFSYDHLSRLEQANYSGNGQFTSSYSYDKHGNIKTLSRKGFVEDGLWGEIDRLKFTHKGNQLLTTWDEADHTPLSVSSYDFKNGKAAQGVLQYKYNQNGALKADPYKGMEIKHNNLNLPVKITITEKDATIDYLYTASGLKLGIYSRQNKALSANPLLNTGMHPDMAEVKQKDYVGNKVYVDGLLDKILIDNGYYDNTDKKYYFYLRDHLGNNRVVADANGTMVQSTEYYPFGMSFGGAIGQDKQQYKYNGKEFDTTNELNQYDYSARYFDPTLARFTSVDPMAEKYYSWSPYAYVANNPMRFTDPTGMWKKDSNGNLVAEDNDTDETLAKYLNTTKEIAISMMLEQQFSTSKNGDITMETNDIFKVGNDRYGDKVGGYGAEIQSLAGSQFSKDMFWNYWNGKGDVEIKGQRFASILLYLKENMSTPEDLDAESDKVIGKVVFFYDSPEYALVFGRATVYYNSKGQIVGFYDNYDFDSKPLGTRTLTNEMKTRLVNTFSPSSAKPFNIRYGKNK